MSKSKVVVKVPTNGKAKKAGKPIKRGVSTEGKTPICEMARTLILKGLDFQKVYAGIKKIHPQTLFSKKCYYWFRSKLKKGVYDEMLGHKAKVPKLA